MAYEMRAPVKISPLMAPSAETHIRTLTALAAMSGKVFATTSTATAPEPAIAV